MIRILYFAQLRETLNCEQEQLQLTDDIATLSDLRKMLSERGARWSTLAKTDKTLAAVNQQMADDESVLRAGDEIAFFRPVTGG